MNPEPILIKEEPFATFIVGVLNAVGVPEEDGRIVADCLLTANLSGIDSHGVVRLAHYIRRLENGTIQSRPQMTFTQTAPSMGLMDGGDGLGHVVTYHATTHAMRLAAEAGTGLVSIGNSSHFGMAGFYILRMVAAGYIGMSMTATDRMLVPFGARKAFFGTNPICFGFPTDGIPVVLDMATTSTAWGKIALAAVEGHRIPDSWALDADGNPTTDPKAVAGMHPFAGPKGSGLAMVIDIFCSLLAGMPWGPHINRMYGEMGDPRRLGHFVMAMDVERLLPLARFKENLGEMLTEFTALEPAAGFDEVCYPGQIEGRHREQRRAEGIPIEPGLAKELAGLGRRFQVPFPG
ncbi:MAG TPA: Ldh family oxidoreductase [Caldilineaceae bacterium]|nr:Ldh family oxidoreductase [Caldilineaceae bacterium]